VVGRRSAASITARRAARRAARLPRATTDGGGRVMRFWQRKLITCGSVFVRRARRAAPRGRRSQLYRPVIMHRGLARRRRSLIEKSIIEAAAESVRFAWHT